MEKYWETEEIFTSGDDYFNSVLRDMENATSYITLEMYIFNNDTLGKKITAQLIKAHQRGVKVQIILDGVGCYDFFDELSSVFQKKGITVKVYNPLPFYHPFYGKLDFSRKFKIFGSRIWRLNTRDHRKIITIDNNIMYTGSFNVTVEHTSHHIEEPWKDMGARVTGKHVNFAVLNFKRNWKLRDYFRFKKKIKGTIDLDWRKSPLMLNQTLFMKGYYYRNFLQRISRAQSRIWLMTPYFIPKRKLIRLLGKAAQKGVDVRLLIAGKTDVKLFHWLQYFYYPYLILKGVKVFVYTKTVLHAKNYIIDDWMTVGSTNLNHRSFLHDLEADLVIQNPENLNKILIHFEEEAKAAKSITEKGLKLRPLRDKLLCRLFFLFKYWF